MKVENNDKKIIVYIFNEFIDINDIDSLNKKIKDIFISIMKRYNYNLFGYNIVHVYHNRYYGLILEVEKISKSDYNYQTIDLKIIVYKDVTMYLEFDDYVFLVKPKSLITNNGKYYLEINSTLNLSKYIEFAKIIYKNS